MTKKLMISRFFYSAIFLSNTIFNLCYSQDITSNACHSSGYVIAFFNGVKNTKEKADESTGILKSIYGDSYNGEPIEYKTFYNPTADFLRDLAEAFKQKEEETPAIRGRWELMWELVNGGTEIATKLIIENPAVEPVINQLRETVVELSKKHADKLISEANFAPIVNDFVSTMTAFITENKKVLVVAHSQGNLFANEVYDIVKPTLASDSLRVVHVAAASATRRGPYTTSHSDLVIQAIRGALSNTLEPNIDVSILAFKEDPSGHGFSEIYMNEAYEAYPVIKYNMDEALNSLQGPNSNGNSGFFTVTLTWDGPGDVDLHVFEPDDSHVYYQNKQGSVGYLDVDNVYEYGPEHYFASCDPNLIKRGFYDIGINNFSKATGRTATVQLITSNRIYSPVKIDVGDEFGVAGDGIPIPVFRVYVSKNQNNTLTARLINYNSL
jgi:hypothetical protein